MKQNFEFEVCVDSVSSAQAAVEGGADRLELCGSLIEGGTTPSFGMIKQVLAVSTIPVHVMIRPRGGDFCYSDEEIQVMRSDIESVKSSGAAGIVIGCLTKDGCVDAVRLKQFITQAKSGSQVLAVTFHRAIDMSNNPVEAIEVLKSLKVDRVLTSGWAPTAPEGSTILRMLVRYGSGTLTVAAGGGINEDNVTKLVNDTGVCSIHASARVIRDSIMEHQRSDMSMGGIPDSEYIIKVACAERVRNIREKALNAYKIIYNVV
eukprot:97426_1